MSVIVRAENFDGPLAHVNGNWDEPVTRARLALAVATVGRGSWTFYVRRGLRSWHEAASRVHMVTAYVETAATGLQTSWLYHALDPSEKAEPSRHLGMGMLRLLAQRKLGIRWTMHVSTFLREHPDSIEFAGRERPDLVGMDNAGMWYILEAKGRERIERRTIAKAKRQLGAVTTINGQTPQGGVAGVLAIGSRPFAVHLEDPPEPNSGENLPIEPADFFRSYYGLFSSPDLSEEQFDFVAGDEWGLHGEVAVRVLPESRIRLGLAADIFREIRRTKVSPNRVRAACLEAVGEGEPANTIEGLAIAPDGMALRLDDSSQAPIEWPPQHLSQPIPGARIPHSLPG